MMTVIKCNLKGRQTWRYPGQVIRRESNEIVLEAFFNRPDVLFQGVVIKRNDRFVETFYTDRWFNIFEIHDRDDDSIKGWYCNICRPAVIDDSTVSYVDLAIDLWVAQDGVQHVLDMDEFEALQLDQQTHDQALAALVQLQERFAGLL